MYVKPTLIAAATFALLAAQAQPALANTPAEGVQCPSGSTARISNGERKLVCEVQQRIERASVCSPVVFRNNGDVNLNTRIELAPAGSDTCLARNTAGRVIASAPSQALFLPGDEPSQFHREVRAGNDVFVRTVATYRFPLGGPAYLGNAAKGVQCETGFDGDTRFNGQGIRCDRREKHRAACDIGWSIDRNTGTDRCYIETIVFGNRVRVDGQYTIPEGGTGIAGNPETHGWDLLRDHQGNVDYWAKEAKEYRFPTASL